MPSSLWFLWSLVAGAALLQSTHALRNVTVDDNDASIVWTGTWTTTPPGFGNPASNTYRVTEERDAFAEFTFTGVAVYLVSARWPIQSVTTRVTLNPGSPNAKPLLLTLEDYSTKTTDKEFGQRLVLARATGLPNVEHTVRVDMGSEPDARYALFDTFVVTTLDAGDSTPQTIDDPVFEALPEPLIEPFAPPPTTTSAAPAATSTVPVSASHSGSLRKSHRNIIIILSVLFVVLGSAAVVAWYFLILRRRPSPPTDESHGSSVAIATTDLERGADLKVDSEKKADVGSDTQDLREKMNVAVSRNDRVEMLADSHRRSRGSDNAAGNDATA